ncbi:ADP-ribosyltransferase [Virgibacillus sp. Bac330]|uniref:ADP-ribosyltransferase n=1 Tax=Virgibacillus sp. Bac330 TaxID=2419841 RepID=UPI000EF49C7C
MHKIDKLIKSLNDFIAKVDDEENIEDVVPDFPGLDKLPAIIEDYEKTVARLLRAQRKRFLNAFNIFVSKDDKQTLEAFLVFLKSDLFAVDEFAEEFGEETAEFLQLTVEELAKLMMESIDKDVPFGILSKRTTDWIQNWSKDLAELMQLNTHKALENELLQAIEDGDSIAEAELRMKEMPQFNRNRARATARTEILTASSRAHYESFKQSPAVQEKKWKHSGAKKINPRATHMAMDGVTIPVDDFFYVDGESGLYPRDPSFTAKNRVHCGCVLGPVVDEDILGLSKDEKEKLRQEALDEMGGPSTSRRNNGKIEDEVSYRPIENIEEWDEKVSEPWRNKLTVAEATAIRNYTDDVYRPINKYLRENKLDGYSEEEIKQIIEDISSGISKFDLEDNIITYRGLEDNIWNLPPEILVGMKLEEQSFVSTSINKAVSFDGSFKGKVQMEWRIPMGTVGAYVNSISEFDHEHEFLLNKGTKYKVIDAFEEDGIIKMIVEVINGA